MDSEAARIVAIALESLESGWNSADGAKFAEPFAVDADFVAIRGDHHHGQKSIAMGHQGIFTSIYLGSRIKYEVAGARRLTGDVILGRASSTLYAPSGPLAGVHQALASVILVQADGQWRIAAFHNTLVSQTTPPSAAAGG